MRTGLFIGDMHAESKFGLTLTPESAAQRKLSSLWKEMATTVKPDFVVVNGDCCEGWNPKEKARWLMTSDMAEQVDTAVEFLNMIKGDPDFVFTEGSGYHVGQNMSLDELVSRDMRGEFGTDKAIDLKDEGIKIHACHNVGYSAVPAYRTTAIARELMVATINADTLGQYDILLRSHVHYHVYVEYGHTAGHVLPCWKVRDPFAMKKGLAMNPKVGWVVYEFYDDGTFQYDRRKSKLVDVKNQIGRVIL